LPELLPGRDGRAARERTAARLDRIARSRVTAAVAALTALALLFGGCTWLKRRMYEGGDRDAWQQPARVVDALGLAEGDRVADLGSGGGYFTFRLAEAVGASGAVYAVDLDADLNEYVAKEAAERGLSQVHTVLAAPDDPRLPEAVDLIFTCNTYHHLEDRVAYFGRLRARLAPGARLAVIDFREGAFRHFTRAETIRAELEAAGYTLEAEYDFLEKQHFLVFRAG
jgi:arsenite methyltransferase